MLPNMEEKQLEGRTVGDIDIEEIMQDIRKSIKESGADKIPLSFDDGKYARRQQISDAALDDAVDYISRNYELAPYQLYIGNPIKVFIKKAIRKLAAFFVIPIVQQQNELNANFMIVSGAVRQQREEIARLSGEIEELSRKIDELSERE